VGGGVGGVGGGGGWGGGGGGGGRKEHLEGAINPWWVVQTDD